MTFVIYLCSMIRSTIALHNLINNRLQIRDLEKGTTEKEKEKEKEKDKEKEKNENSEKEKNDNKEKEKEKK